MSSFSRGLLALPPSSRLAIFQSRSQLTRSTLSPAHCLPCVQVLKYASVASPNRSKSQKGAHNPTALRPNVSSKKATRPQPPRTETSKPSQSLAFKSPPSQSPESLAANNAEEVVLYEVNRTADLRMLLSVRLLAASFMAYPLALLSIMHSSTGNLAEASTWSQYGFYGIIAIMEGVGGAWWYSTMDTVTKIVATLPGPAGKGQVAGDIKNTMIRVEGRGSVPFIKKKQEVSIEEITKSRPLAAVQYDILSRFHYREQSYAPLSEVPAFARPFASFGAWFRRFFWSFKQGTNPRDGRVWLFVKPKGRLETLWRIFPANGTLKEGSKSIDQLVQDNHGRRR